MTALQNNDQYIGELLVRDGVITAQDLERGLSEQKNTHDFLCSTLVRMGFASEEKIFSILSLQIGVPFLSLRDVRVDAALLKRIPGNFASACTFFPLKEENGCVYVAMADPLDTRAVKEIKSYVGTEKLKVFLSGDLDIRQAIKAHYGL